MLPKVTSASLSSLKMDWNSGASSDAPVRFTITSPTVVTVNGARIFVARFAGASRGAGACGSAKIWPEAVA